jgi:hypothetical protein
MQTVINAFDDKEAAQRAVERLLEAGFPRDQVQLRDAQAATAAGVAAGHGGGHAPRRGVLSSIGRFLVSALGGDHAPGEVDRYAEGTRRGMCVVLVDAPGPEEAGLAAGILKGAGAHQWESDDR